MKIGIISINMYTKGLNFACPLHTYAFQQFLTQHGIDSTVINYKPVYYGRYDLRHPYHFYEALVNRRYERGDLEDIDVLIEKRDGYKALYKEREIRYDKFQKFIDDNYVKTDVVYDSDLLDVKDPGFDCYICATDVIWKKDPGGGFDRGFFLASKAMENKWKIAYAASRGVYHSESSEDERRFLHYMDDIDFIGVREESLKEYIERYTDKTVSLVLDPVMLHERSFYDAIAQKPEQENYLFLYYVMEKAADTIDQAVAYAKAHNLTIVETTDRPLPEGRIGKDAGVNVIYRYDVGIEEWLGYFKYASVVFTNSFHASCFSILFEKEFFVGSRSGDKVTNVLRTFGLQDRRFNRSTDLLGDPRKPIDYALVRPILAEKRKQSADFLLGAIAAAESSARPKTNYEWWQREQTYEMLYRCKAKEGVGFTSAAARGGERERREDGSLAYRLNEKQTNDGLSCFAPYCFGRAGHVPAGWRMRFKIDNKLFWYLEDGSFVLCAEWDKKTHAPIRLFREYDRIPFIPLDRISLMIAEAVWRPADTEQFEIIYNSGARSCKVNRAELNALEGQAEVLDLQSGSLEYRSAACGANDGSTTLNPSCFIRSGYDFIGWKVRVKSAGKWYWLLEDGALAPQESWTKEDCGPRCVISDGSLPYLAVRDVDLVVAEAVWRVRYSQNAKLKRGMRRVISWTRK